MFKMQQKQQAYFGMPVFYAKRREILSINPLTNGRIMCIIIKCVE